MKKITALMLSLILMVAFALTIGCKKEEPKPAETAPAATPAPAAPATPAPAPAAPAK